MNFDVNFVTAIVVKMIVAFLVSQGSVDTQLMCGGKHDKSFTANFLLNPKVKN